MTGRAGDVEYASPRITVLFCGRCGAKVTHWSLDFVAGTNTNKPCGCVLASVEGRWLDA